MVQEQIKSTPNNTIVVLRVVIVAIIARIVKCRGCAIAIVVTREVLALTLVVVCC